MDKLKKKPSIKGKAPEAYLYEKPAKEKPVKDKDLFILNKNKK
jgi:hypothetical protein